MDQNPQGSADTGTRDETYDLVAVVYHALQGAENCQTYAQDASGRQELRQFFDRACDLQRQLADEGKRLLHDQLMKGGQMGGGSEGGSAFGQLGSSGQGGSSSGMGGSGGMGGQDMGSNQDRQGGSAYTSGESVGAQGNDPSMSQFGQSATGQGQRHNEMSTGGGGTSTF